MQIYLFSLFWNWTIIPFVLLCDPDSYRDFVTFVVKGFYFTTKEH